MQLISWDRELARERELRRQVTFSEALRELGKSHGIGGVLLAKTLLLCTYLFLLVFFLERAHRPTQRKELSVSCNTKITREKERNDVSLNWDCVLFSLEQSVFCVVHAFGHNYYRYSHNTG